MLQDPSGILQRVPELETLTGDPAIRDAIEGGDSFKIYRALVWARLRGRLTAQRETLLALLRRRRLFAKPVKGGGPWLSRINGFGATFLGKSELDPDGTHVTTHALVIFFVVPLLPLGAYLVRKESSEILRSSWSIFARVPLGPVSWVWRRLVALGAAAGVLLVAAAAVHSARYGDVRVLNPFDVPVSVTVGERADTVPAASDVVVGLPVGKHRARAVTAGGIEVDALDLDVTSGKRVLAWNLGGAMPVLLLDIVYSSALASVAKSSRDGSKPADDPEPPPRAIYCGQRLIQLLSVDYAFRPPDEKLGVKGGSGRVVKTYLGYEKGAKDNPRRCFSYLMQKGREAEAAGFLETAARIARWDPEISRAAVHARLASSAAQALRLAKEARDARPNEIELHRTYQIAAERAGAGSELVEEYRKRAEAEPGSADGQYLYARLLHGTRGRALVDELTARFPDHVYLLRSSFYLHFRAGDWRGAHAAWAKLRAKSAEAAAELADEEIRALVGIGKYAEAIKLAGATFNQGPVWMRTTMAYGFARAVLVAGVSPADALIVRVEADSHLRPGEKLWLLRHQSGLKVPKEATAPGLALERAALEDPAAAVRLAGLASEADIGALGHATWALLYCEAARLGNAGLEKSLARSAGATAWVGWGELERLRKLVRLELADSPEVDLDPELLAAALLVRSRNQSLTAVQRKALVDEARHLDVLHGPVTNAIPAWKI